MTNEMSFGIGANKNQTVKNPPVSNDQTQTSQNKSTNTTVPQPIISHLSVGATPSNIPAQNSSVAVPRTVMESSKPVLTNQNQVFSSTSANVQSTYQFERLMNVNRSMFDNLIEIQRKNNILLNQLNESSRYLAKISKKRHRLEVVKFWIMNIKYFILIVTMAIGFILSYQMINSLMSIVSPAISQLNQSANTIQDLNGSLGKFDMQNLNLDKILNNSANNKPTDYSGTQNTKNYPSSTTEPNTTFTTPAFIDNFKNIDLSNVDGESILEKLNINPYKPKQIEVPVE